MNGFIGTSVSFLEDLYRRYEADPMSVDVSWRAAFDLARALSQHDGSNGQSNDANAATALLGEIVRQRGHLDAKIDPLGRSRDDDRGIPSAMSRSPARRATCPNGYRRSIGRH